MTHTVPNRFSMRWPLILLLAAALLGCSNGGSGSGSGGGNPAQAVAPSITSPPSNATVALGQTATFSVSAAGTAPLTYQWKKGGVDISDAQSSSYTTPPVISADDGSQYAVVVTNSAASVSSAAATLSVMTPPLATTLSVGFGLKELQFSWTASSGTTSYRLMKSPDGGAAFTQVGADLPAGALQTTLGIAVHRENWAVEKFAMDACNLSSCSRSNQVAIAPGMLDAIGYFKASNPNSNDFFGQAVSLSGDGNTLAVGAYAEDSAATGVNGNQADNSASNAGAVYVFTRVAGVWSQQAYLKASNTGSNDLFGTAVALTSDGNTLAVAAQGEASAAAGINGDQTDNSATDASAVYVFTRTSGVWSQQAYLKSSNLEAGDRFQNIAISADGGTLAVGAPGEDSSATGVNGDQSDNLAVDSGAIYVFTRSASTWSQQAYLKASNTGGSDLFGAALALSADGNTLAVDAVGEDSAATGIDGSQGNNAALHSGAVYVFTRSGSTWSQQAYVKASNTDANDSFGSALAISGDGNTLSAGAFGESSLATGINGNQADNSGSGAGAVLRLPACCGGLVTASVCEALKYRGAGSVRLVRSP